MASIVFLVDVTEGHVYPTFGLAHSLKREGHSITYISIPDNESIIRSQGFEFYTIFQDIYPKGLSDWQKDYDDPRNDSRNAKLIPRFIQGELDAFFEKSRPDVLIINIFMCLEALVLHYKYKIRPVILTPYLPFPGASLADNCTKFIMERKGKETALIAEWIQSLGLNLRTFEQLLSPLSKAPELVLCPQELETEPLPGKRNSYYIQPSIHAGEISEAETLLTDIHEGKRIIYAALGSNTSTYTNETRIAFYGMLINVMKKLDMPDVHLIMAVGRNFDTAILGNLPANLTVLHWAPQILILKKASLAILPGGLGSIKECIYYGVPMIIIPVKNDQLRNGEMIRIRGLGLSRYMDEITEEMLLSDTRQVLNDDQIRKNVKNMQHIFRKKEEAQPGNKVIEALLNRAR